MKNNLIANLVDALRCLPGIGPRSAQRMAYHLLLSDRHKGKHLADSLTKAMDGVVHCRYCNNFSIEDVCELCLDDRRDLSQLCIVEMPLDVVAIEQTHVFRGHYFVLMGHLSPLEGVGPEDLALDKLHALFSLRTIKEVIFAINPTVEGEATVHFLKEELASYDVSLTQLASGVPVGGELEYLDVNTIGQALLKRDKLIA